MKTDKGIKVTFKPEEKTVYCLPGSNVLEIAQRAGIGINSPCGGEGRCGKCLVKIIQGKSGEASSREKELIPGDKLKEGYRLACQRRIYEETVIEIPQSSRFFNSGILVKGIMRKVLPKVSLKKIYLEMPSPSINDPTALLETIEREINGRIPLKKLKANIYLLRQIAVKLRDFSFKATFVLYNEELISIESGDTTKKNYGIAFDIGTTTVVGSLIDLNKIEELDVSARTNPQVAFGADVISRINFTIQKGEGLKILHESIIGCLNEIIAELMRKKKISPEYIYEVSIVGNTTMQHLFLNFSPQSLAASPYVPTIKREVVVSAKKLNLRVNDDAIVYVSPNIAGFVGGDTIAGILATNQHQEKKLRLLVDIGTNGEVVLGNEKRLVAASAAAGPAFEGAQIKCGMRAMAGAIDRVTIENDLSFNVIGDVEPVGICGTGLIELTAALLKKEIIEKNGRFKNRDELKSLSPSLLNRIVEKKTGNEFILDKERKIYITQADIRQVQLAKAAFCAAIKTLQKRLSIKEADIEEILLAGAFGSFINVKSAFTIGLLPLSSKIPTRFIGNSALVGSKMILISEKVRVETEGISRFCEHTELFRDSEFQNVFVESLPFP